MIRREFDTFLLHTHDLTYLININYPNISLLELPVQYIPSRTTSFSIQNNAHTANPENTKRAKTLMGKGGGKLSTVKNR